MDGKTMRRAGFAAKALFIALELGVISVGTWKALTKPVANSSSDSSSIFLSAADIKKELPTLAIYGEVTTLALLALYAGDKIVKAGERKLGLEA